MKPAETQKPESSATATLSESGVWPRPHILEEEVLRRLSACPDLKISSLVVRRIEGGVCLEGTLEVDIDPDEVDGLVQRVPGVRRVLNRLVQACPTRRVPKKG